MVGGGEGEWMVLLVVLEHCCVFERGLREIESK